MTQGREFLNKVALPGLASRLMSNADEMTNAIYVIGKDPSFDYKACFHNPIVVDKNPIVEPDILDDICNSKLLTESAIAVILVGVYEFLEDPPKAITEIHRVLKPGGYLLTALPGKGYWPGPGETCARVTLDMIPELLKGFKIYVINNFYAENNELEASIIFAEKI